MFRIHTVVALACCTALTGCLVPEKFTASADFKPDGSYRYQFDGTVVNALAAMEIQKNGKLNDAEKAKIKKALDKEASQPGMQKLQAMSDTRYALKYDGQNTDTNKMPVTMEDGPKVLQIVFGEGITSAGKIPESAENYAKAVSGINEMLTKNPFKREAK